MGHTRHTALLAGRYGGLRQVAFVVWLLSLGAGALCAGSSTNSPGAPFGDLLLVDEVVCGDPLDPHLFSEYPAGISGTQSILGVSCRVLPNDSGEMKYFAYRVGQGKGLVAGRDYVLCVDYPEDEPRSMFICNRGCETTRGLHSGSTVGDALDPPYVGSNPESLQLPLSGDVETWQMLFALHDRFPDIKQPRSTEYQRPHLPADGFWVIIAQFAATNAPLSEGAAVSHIRLFEAPDYSDYRLSLNLPRHEMPSRHLFWREEMSDAVIGSSVQTNRGVYVDQDWYEYKARLMKFLGVNTFSKDLLEFGSNQGWDSSLYGGNSWYYGSAFPYRWQEILEVAADYELGVLPYYEYYGSKGSEGLGFERRCEPLYGPGVYTHVSWAETANADCTDPDTFADAKKLLDATIVRHKDKADFVGAWFRTRPSAIPMSFSDRVRGLFAIEANGGIAVSRDDLENDANLLDAYYEWWLVKRHDFTTGLREHLLTNGVNDSSVLLYTCDASESGDSFKEWGNHVVTDDTNTWSSLVEDFKSFQDASGPGAFLDALTSPRLTWSWYEWQHSIPWPDPAHYTETHGAMLTHTMHKGFSVADTNSFDAFRTPSGLAVIRHYCLNENTMHEYYNANNSPQGDDILGYFVSDIELAGPLSMRDEAHALAYGDPRFLGYLASGSFNRGFPEYTRKFNANFLALPWLPSVLVTNATSHTDVLVRRIDTAEFGTYLGVVNVGYYFVSNVIVQLPGTGAVFAAATGDEVSSSTNSIALDLHACELRSLHFVSADLNMPPLVDAGQSQALAWPNMAGSGYAVQASLSGAATDDGRPAAAALTPSWSVASGGGVTFSDSSAFTCIASFTNTGTYVLRLAVSDGDKVGTNTVTMTVARQVSRLPVVAAMIDNESGDGNPEALFDEPELAGDPPRGYPLSSWTTWAAPSHAIVDFSNTYNLVEIWLHDYTSSGAFEVAYGSPGGWTSLVSYTTASYKAWKRFTVDVNTRYLRFTKHDNSANISEVVLYERGGVMDASPLDVTNSEGATNVIASAAVLRGWLVSGGGLPTTGGFYWGLTDGLAERTNWSSFALVGELNGGLFTNAMMIDPDTRYYYRAYATNASGEKFASDTRVFGYASPGVLTFRETFQPGEEDMAGVPGPLHIQHGWQTTSEIGATVQSEGGTAGNQFCQLDAASARHEFSDAETNVWIRMRLKPVLSAGVVEDVPAGSTGVFWVNAAGNVVVYDGRTPVELTNATIDADAWTDFDMHLDYSKRTWSLWIGGVQAASNLVFYTPSVSAFGELEFFDGSASGGSWLDSVRVQRSSTIEPRYRGSLFLLH